MCEVCVALKLAAASGRTPKNRDEAIQMVEETLRGLGKSPEAARRMMNEAISRGDSMSSKSGRPNNPGQSHQVSIPDEFVSTKIHSIGSKLVIPVGMPTEIAIALLFQKQQQDGMVVNVSHEIEAFPAEGAYALLKFLEETYGFVNVQGQTFNTPFGPINKPAMMIGVEIEPGKNIQVPWGQFQLPGIEGALEASHVSRPDGTCVFKVSGEVTRRSEDRVVEIVNKLREYLKTNSLFKGKAITVEFPEAQSDGTFNINPQYMPKVMDLSKVNPEELVFSLLVEKMMETSVFGPIKNTERYREFGIPLKSGIGFMGPFGTGKSFAAQVVALVASKHGWTFISTKKAKDLRRAIVLARQYQPAIVFVEDLDSAFNGNVRNDDINLLLETVDGIDSKKTEIMIIGSSNHPELINPAMLRSGRLDCIIPMHHPDDYAAGKLIRVYAKGHLAEGEDVSEAAKLIAGHNAAFVHEVVQRAKRMEVNSLLPGQPLHISGDSLVAAAEQKLAEQQALTQPVVKTFESEEVEAAHTLGTLVAGAIKEGLGNLQMNGQHKTETAAQPTTTA